jgi:hypothetical protein
MSADSKLHAALLLAHGQAIDPGTIEKCLESPEAYWNHLNLLARLEGECRPYCPPDPASEDRSWHEGLLAQVTTCDETFTSEAAWEHVVANLSQSSHRMLKQNLERLLETEQRLAAPGKTEPRSIPEGDQA